MNGIVIYKSRYGATKQYAEWISDGLRLPLIDPERLDIRLLHNCDFLVIGSPVYFGNMQIKDWLQQQGHRLEGKKLFFFIVCAVAGETEKENEIIEKNFSGHLPPGSSAYFLPGRVVMNDLTWSDGLKLRLGASLEANPAKRQAMLQDRDAVQKQHIDGLLQEVGDIYLSRQK